MKRKEFEAELMKGAIEKIESNMEWGLTRIREFHADPEKVIDQVYGFNMGVIAVMPEQFYVDWLDNYTDKWNNWLAEARA